MKDEILNVAIQQMKEGGYHALSFARIADVLGTTRANLHHHFKNKEGLGLAATERYIEMERQVMEDIFRSSGGDLRKLLREIERLYLELAIDSRVRCSCICTQLIFESDAPETLRERAKQRFRDEGVEIEAQVRSAISLGHLDSASDASRLSFSIVTAMHGMIQMILFAGDRAKLARQIEGSLVSLI